MSMTTNRYFAEVNSFHEQRVKDIKSSHQHFLQEQIKFYQKVVSYYTLCIMIMYIICNFLADYRETSGDLENV